MNHVQKRLSGRSGKATRQWMAATLRVVGIVFLGAVWGGGVTSAQPANDAFASAIALSDSSGTTNGTTFGATMQAGEPRYMTVGDQSVWYTWVAPSNGFTTFEANVKSSDAVVVAYTGAALNSLNSLTPATESVSSAVTFFATAGSTYRVAVIGGFDAVFNGEFILNWHQGVYEATSFLTNRFAGEFRFSVARYSVGEFDSTAAPIPTPDIPFRSPDGAVVTVQRVGGTSGRVLVDYRTVDEYGENFFATVVSDVVSVTNSPTTYTNRGTVTVFLTNAYTRVSNALSFSYTTNWGSTESFCGPGLTNCIVTNVFQNCSTDFSSTWACPNEDYSPVPEFSFFGTGTLVFDDFETIKKFVVPVFSDGGPPASDGNGLNTIRLELFNQRLAPEEIINDTGILRPVRTATGSTALIDIVESLPRNGGTNFFIERTHYAVEEGTASVSVDILQPSGVGGTVVVRVLGAENQAYPWFPSAGSDYASSTASTYQEPTYTDGTTGFIGAQDFTAPGNSLTFNVGTRRIRLTIPLLDDNEVEFNEDIYVALESVPGSPPVLGNSEAWITILYQETPAGSLDRDWNSDNVSTTTPRFNPSPGANSIVRAVAVQADDKTIIGGDFTAYNSFPANRIARIDTTGAYDPTFSSGSGADEFVAALAIYPSNGGANDGKIVVGGGFTSFNNTQRNGIARLNSDGSLDASFDPGFGVNGVVRSVAIQSDGKVLIAGEFSQVDGENRFNVARLNADGSLDSTFDAGLGPDGVLWTVAVSETPTRKIFVGGEFMDFNGAFRGNVARLNDDGSLDLTFDPGGGADGPVYSIAPLADGRVVIGGFFEQFDYLLRPRIARLLGSGLEDPTFQPGSGPNDAVYSIVIQPDGKIMVGGVFTSYNGTRRMGLSRLFSNGTVDTSFLDTAYNQFAGLINNFGYEPPNYVNALALQSDGNVMIGGSFYQIGGNPAEALVNNSAPYLFGEEYFVWTRADKRPRSNVARLNGGYTPGPGNVSYVLSRNTVDENSPIQSVPLRRFDGRLGTITAMSSTADNLATNGVDFTGVPFEVLWIEGAYAARPISAGYVGEFYHEIGITDDTSIEGDELFGLSLSNPSGSISLGMPFGGDAEIIPLGGALGVQESVGSITDNDFNKGVLAFGAPTYYTSENGTFALLNVIRTNGAVGLISVRYFTLNGSATNGIDYTGVNLGTISFGSGETNKTISIAIRDDFTVEADKFFRVVLTNAAGGASIYGATLAATNSISASVFIVDNDLLSGGLQSGKAYFSNTNFSANESAGTGTVTVRRLGGSVGPLQVAVAISAGTAANGTDFTGSTNVISWVDNDITPRLVSVPILNDNDIEANETINLQLVNPSPVGATGAVNTATLTIVEDDSYGSLSFSQALYDVDERGTNVTITVVRTGGSGGTVTVDYTTVDQTAVAPTDYSSSSGTLILGPGVIATNFQVSVVENADADGERTIGLLLQNFVNAGAGTVISADLRIVDDESSGDLAGSLDPTFNPLAGTTNAINSVVLQPDGKMIVGGDFVTLNRTARNRLGRLNPDGTLDPSFTPRSGPNGIVQTMALQEDGRLVVGGFFTTYVGTNRNYIARLLADGTLDGFFNPGSGADNPVYSVVVCPDRRIAVGGAFATMNGISRSGIALLETNGSVSASFNPGLGVAGTVYAIAVQPDGRLLVGGDFDTVGGVSRPKIARLNVDGSLDTTFDSGAGPNALVRSIALQADGKVLIGGSFTNVNGTARGYLARLNSDGSVDSAFMTAVDGGNGPVNSIALQFDGKIVVAGEFSQFNGVTRNGLTRLNRNGKTDATINFGSGANAAVNSVIVQPDRKLVLGGRFTTYDGQTRAYIARIHGGSIDGAGLLQFASASYEVLENGIEASILVQRKGGTTGDITVDYQALGDTATAGVDFSATSGTLTFLEAETFQSFIVSLIDDSADEDIEQANLVLSNPTIGASLGAIPTASLVIVSDETGIGFSAAEYSVNEGVPVGSVLVTVTRTGLISEAAVVGYATSDGTATAGSDYVATAGLLNFAPGVNLLNFTIPIIDDSLIESRETINLSLYAVSANAVMSSTSAVVAIVENDFRAGQLTFSATNYSVLENAGTFDISVVRTNGSTGVLTVDYETVNGTALGTNDFVTQSGTLTFVEGQTNQTIRLVLLDDVLVEGSETFSIRLKNPGPGTVIAGTTNVQVNLLDDDISVVIPAGSSLVSESLNSNGIIDPGETVSLSLAVRNIGSGNTPSLTATLLPTAGIGSPSAPQSYGVLVANGPSEARTFSFTATGATGDRLQVTLQMSDGSAATFAYTVGGQASRTFSNTNRIVINDDAPASTYPSGIDVANLGGTVTSMTVTLTNFTHDWPNDVDVLLIGPSGKRVMLMSDAGTNIAVAGLTMTFSDSATAAVPLLTRLQTRSYRLANYAAPGLNTADRFASPAPQPIPLTDPFPYTNTSLAIFNGTSPNGTWVLYVMDDTSGQAGSIGGWSLNIQTSDPVSPAAGVSVSDLAVTASNPAASAVMGGHVTTTLTVTNKGPAPAFNAALIEELASGLSLVSATPSAGTWTKVQNQLTWTVGTLPSGGTATLTVVTRPQAVGVFTSTVSVAANQTDPNTGNNSLVLTTTASGVPALAVVRTGNSVSLSWLASSGFKLQVSDSLTSANWTDVGTVPQVVGGQNVVSVVAAGNKFFRLRAP